MSNRTLQGKWALVTGASSGLGADFARDLAGRGCNLVLVARREENLRTLQGELTGRHGVQVEIVPMDLAKKDAPLRLYEKTREMGIAIDVLINNAGFGLFGEFAGIPWERERNMLELDIIALVHLTKLFVRDMVDRQSGYILQVGSVGAFQPTPVYATYGAGKSFVLSFGEALGYELRHTGVSCTVLSPGATATEFMKVAGQELRPFQQMFLMDSRKVVRIGIDGMLQRRHHVVPGVINRVAQLANRLLPRRAATALAYSLMA